MPPSLRRRGGRARRSGFTLLEVLVAVAVLGLLYVTIARVAIQGMRSEGEASRRLEASLLADRALAEVETQIARGAAPPVGEESREERGYRVEVAVEPFEAREVGLASVLAELDPPSAGEEAGRRRPGESTRRREGPPELVLLEPPQRGARPALLQVRVRVAWRDAARERSVTRTTFALDREEAASHLEAVAAADEEADRGGESEGAQGEGSGSARAPGAGSAAGAEGRGARSRAPAPR